MKALSILGTASDSGKSWINTAFCALLKRKGYRVAPFKAQNMSNNSYVTLEGGEIGRAQAAQAEACGLRPIAQMNPVLLKPCGDSTSQVVLLGIPREHVKAGNYYRNISELWEEVTTVLDGWRNQCDILMMEGAGSPVELNIMDRDIVNLKPIEYLDGRWLLACDIECGGVFAQAMGTVNLMPPADQARGLGLIVNKFRGDIRLFDHAGTHFAKHLSTPYLGTLPMRFDLQPETEDGFTRTANNRGEGAKIAWIRLPRVSNTSDAQPWDLDSGAWVQWVTKPSELKDVDIIVIPGTKNTLSDWLWMCEQGLDNAILEKARTGTPVVGICGGYQMLGKTIADPKGIAGHAGTVQTLGLLPINTTYEPQKYITQVNAHMGGKSWKAYEIHMGKTEISTQVTALLEVENNGKNHPEGIVEGKIWGTYLHGLFEESIVRETLIASIHAPTYRANPTNWQEHKEAIYTGMADLIEEHLDLEGVFRYVDA